MSTSHKRTHQLSALQSRKGLWVKLGALTILVVALVFAVTNYRRVSANSAALEKAHSNLQTAMAKLKANRTAATSAEVQKALNAYRALGGNEAISAMSLMAAPQSSKAVAFGISQPARNMTPVITPGQNVAATGKDITKGKKNEFPLKTTNPNAPGSVDTKIQSTVTPRPNPVTAPIQNFEGLNGDGNIPIFGGRVLPPDTVGDVGPNHYVQAVNTLWQVFSKTGVAQTGVLSLGSLWANIPGACAGANDGDPIVLYDPLADRWMISQFCTVANPNNHQLIAISQTADPTGSWYLYDFMMPNNKFNDYPHFGVWPDGYYMSDNQFNQAGTAFLGAGCFAFERKKMLQGDPTASFIYFDVEPIDPNAGGMLPTDLDGVNTPPIGMPNLFMEFRADDFGDPLDAIRIYEFHADFATPANSTLVVRPDVALAAFDARNPGGRADIEQPGGVRLDSIADRLMNRLTYRTLAGGVQSFVLNFTVNVSGVNPTGNTTHQAGIRWTELHRTGTSLGTVTVNNEGTYAPGAGNGATGRNIWMGSAAQDYLGNIALGFSASSTTLNPSIMYAGRLAGDPAGQLAQGEATLITGGGFQTDGSSRWGDYSAMSVDPVDETTFWYTQEYYSATAAREWKTRIGSFKVDSNAQAQPKGTIAGQVTVCAGGAPVANAVVMTADGFFRQTDASGNFSFPVAPGTYTVMVIPPFGYTGAGCTQTVTVAGNGTATVNCCVTAVPVTVAMGSSLTAESCLPGNNALDPGETVTVSLGVKNTGAADTVNLVGTLQATGGVTSPSSSQNYGVVVAGGATVNRSFTFTVDPNQVCGSVVTASLQLQDGNSNLGTVTYTFQVGALGAPTTATYSSGNIAVNIIDEGTVDVPITVSDTGVVQDINVRVRLNHTFDSDLNISLVAPDNTIVALSVGNGASGDNFGNGTNNCSGTPTVFDDSAANSITTGTAPFAATFRPESPLSGMNGKASNGTWKLRVTDTAAQDVGIIGCVTLEITRASYVCCTSVPPCVLTPPSSITTANTPGSCATNVNYPAPTSSGTCGAITCLPASGSSFPVGTTTVNCTSATGGGATSFTVTVQDTQAPSITCPANVVVNSAVPSVANYAAPAVSDNCPGVGSPTCNPASGSLFPVGTTTVTCTVDDASPNSPAGTCSFTVTVTTFTPVPTASFSDPLACTGPGNKVNGSFGVANTTGVSQTGTVMTALPPQIVGLANMCSSNFGSCSINGTTVSWSGTIPANQTLAVSYMAQVADGTTSGTYCATTTAVFNAVTGTIPACLTVNCPTAGPGLPFPAASETSDQNAGSVLIYNIYTSGATSGNTQNTRMNITNSHPSLPAFVHLFFVSEGCSVADSYICLTGNQTASFLASDLDPGVTGYLVAVAVDGIRGCPTNFNFLIGDEYVKFATGHAANLGAEAISALAGGLPLCDGNSVTSQLDFNGIAYDRISHVLADDSVGSRADGNDKLLILNRIGGNLGTGAGSLSSVFGLFYDDAENALSFTFSGGHQFRSSLSNNFPRITPRFETFIPAGRTGWFKVWPSTPGVLWGMTGATINFNPNSDSSSGAFNQGHNLHKLTLTNQAVYTIPVFPPSC